MTTPGLNKVKGNIFNQRLDAQYEIQILNGLYCPRDRHEKRPIHVVSLVHDLCTGAFRQKQAQDQANKEPFAVAHI